VNPYDRKLDARSPILLSRRGAQDMSAQAYKRKDDLLSKRSYSDKTVAFSLFLSSDLSATIS
jgi:hypothetical protein